MLSYVVCDLLHSINGASKSGMRVQVRKLGRDLVVGAGSLVLATSLLPCLVQYTFEDCHDKKLGNYL